VGPLLAALLLALPVTWWLPLFTARVPFLWREEISIASGLVELWRLDLLLFFIVLVFSVIAPTLKLATSLYVWHRVPTERAAAWLERLTLLGKLSMAELFLLALVIVGFKGVGIGRIEVAWGLHAFAGVVLLSLAASIWAEWTLKRMIEPPAGLQAG
jgi:paraquat-inducible protein A